MSDLVSVVDKARAVAAEASRIRLGSAAEHDAERVVNRVDEILAELQRLRGLVAAAGRFNEVSGSERVSLAGLDDGQAALARHARAGLPSNQAFSAAKQKITGVIGRATAALSEAWAAWTSQRIGELPLGRISLLAIDQQEPARERLTDLQRLARVPVPSRADISLFSSGAEGLAEMLAEVPDLSAEGTALIQLLGQPRALTLADLTDAQITLLRETGIAGQVELRWRGM